jgi:phosphatidylinositol glycan class O
MAPRSSKPKAEGGKASNAEYKAIAQQWAKAQREREMANNARAAAEGDPTVNEATAAEMRKVDDLEQRQAKIDKARKKGYERRWLWTVAFWVWVLGIHALGIVLFTSGFLLTRMVLEDKSECARPPIDLEGVSSPAPPLNHKDGCWHPKTFDRAVVVVIDALRYDFTVPQPAERAQQFHNAFPFLHETAVQTPQNAFLLPFIADPPTTTVQRLKGLTTGTLPTFIDAGSSFGGEAIEEDNLLMQLKMAGKKVAHVGDDTWWSLFPGYFEPNISKPFDSFNVWDLHTVDNGVIDNVLPLLESGSGKRGEWDLLIGHCLGVDHAGHRYGPDHAAMTAKLRQMDEFIRKVANAIDDETVLIVMGDHGMDSKGDHGGESDDEVEAALWVYSKKPVFGRTNPEFIQPPETAKIRPVNQIDLVPTLALLLGIPIPYNNLGMPIEEAFAGPKGSNWQNLMSVARLATAGIERYQASYFAARGIAQTTGEGSPADLFQKALTLTKSKASPMLPYRAFVKFQQETLSVCKDLWARFDVPRMIMGVAVAAVGVLVLVMYSSRDEDDDFVVTNDIELDYAEQRLELLSLQGEVPVPDDHPEQTFHKDLIRGLWDWRVMLVLGLGSGVALYRGQNTDAVIASGTTTLLMGLAVSMVQVVTALQNAGKTLVNILPNTIWGLMAAVFTIGQSIGFASNSYTVWEDSILLFFITTFGVVSAVAAFRIPGRVERTLGIYHSVAFIVLSRLASISKLCREEQMPFCTSTYYASAASSTAATWQLAIPVVVMMGFPTIIRSFLVPTRSWEGLAPVWVRYVFRANIFVAAIYWLIDAADNGGWLDSGVSSTTVKTAGVYIAQLGLAQAFVAGTTAFIWAPPNVSVVSTASDPNAQKQPQQQRAQIMILGYGNAQGARYLLLLLNIVAGLMILTKPMGIGALALMLWQILSLAELVDALGLKSEAIGPVMLAMLGNFYFFRTGHQATPQSIQWDSAFIALQTLRYPWSPLSVTLNTFGPQILAAASVPLVACLWKVGPKQKGVLGAASRALGLFASYYAVEAVATMSWAGWLRRHLMLYRVFCPRYIMAVGVLLLVDVLGVGIALLGLRSNTLSVGDVFGYVE